MNSSTFRLSSILYSEQNYHVTSKTLLRKIVETVFLISNNQRLNVNEIISKCKELFYLDFSSHEIFHAISKNSHFYFEGSEDDFSANLKETRYSNLQEKESHNLERYITEFLDTFKIQTTKTYEYIEDLLRRFLYTLLNSHIDIFKKLVCQNKSKVQIPSDSIEFSEEDKGIIDDFLKWDNPEKDKAVYDLVCLSMEYCLISNKKDVNKPINHSLKLKTIYLDTNVIFRALGLDGVFRQELILTFLAKCSDFQQEIKISQFTDIEFRNTIKAKTAFLSRYHSIQYSHELYNKYSKNEDIYNYYHQWKDKNIGLDISFFNSHILSEYDELKRKYKISVDRKDVKKIVESDKSVIDKYSTELLSYRKKKNGHKLDRDIHDATNTLLIEKLRESNSFNVLSTKYFIISTDQEFGKWDNERQDDNCNIVLLPSYWLAFLLRYGSRTDDDFKSFSKFVTLRKHSPHIDNSKLEMIFACVCTISSNSERQNYLVSNLVDSQFKERLINTTSENEVTSITFDFSQQLLDQRFDDQKEQIDSLKLKNDELLEEQKKTRIDINTILTEVKPSSEELKSLREENKRQRIFINKIKAIALIVLGILLLSFCFFEFTFTSSSWNFAYKLRKAIEGNESLLLLGTLGSLNYGFFIAFPLFLFWRSYLTIIKNR